MPYFIRGAAFSKLYPGLQIKDYNTQTFMVPLAFTDLARELLSDFIQPPPQPPQANASASPSRIFRVVIEMLLAGWVFTGKRWNKHQSTDDKRLGDDV